MDGNKVNKWLSLGANLGVLAGIMLLAYEINQATLTTRAEMISSHSDRWVTIDLSWQDREFAAAWAKAMEDPKELTLTEMIQLNGFMWSYFDHLGTSRRLWELGILDDLSETPEEVISDNSYIFFGNKFSRAWLEENRENIGPRTMEIVDQVLSKVTADETLDSYTRIKARIGE
jgi:hypothetical protein